MKMLSFMSTFPLKMYYPHCFNKGEEIINPKDLSMLIKV